MLDLNLLKFVKLYPDCEIMVRETTPLPTSFNGRILLRCFHDDSHVSNLMVLASIFFVNFIKKTIVGDYTIDLFFKYFPYSRQDRITDDNKLMTSQVVTELLYNSGVDRIIALDVHNPAVFSCYRDKFISVGFMPFLIKAAEVMSNFNKSFVVVYTDIGAFNRFSGYFDGFECITLHKKRDGNDISIYSAVVDGGDISAFNGRNFVFVDDIVFSARSINAAVDYLKQYINVGNIILFATHIFIYNYPYFEVFNKVYTCSGLTDFCKHLNQEVKVYLNDKYLEIYNSI